MLFINFNGNIIDAATPVFTSSNRLRFGDGFFESMRMFNRKIAFIDAHFQRIGSSIATLKMDLPESFTKEFLEQEILKLSHKNKCEFARVRVQFFRNGDGRYLPVENAFSYVIEMADDGVKNYTLHSVEKLGISQQLIKPKNEIGNVKSSSGLLYVLASIEAQTKGIDEMILLNTNAEVCEALSSNIFVARLSAIYTPDLDSGCVDGVMRKAVIEILKSSNLTVVEGEIFESDLLAADEIFLTNASKGIQSVRNFLQHKIILDETATFLTKKLNELLNPISKL